MVKDQQLAEKMWQYVVELHPDKKGKEPWNALNLADEGQNVLFEELRKSFPAKCDARRTNASFIFNE